MTAVNQEQAAASNRWRLRGWNGDKVLVADQTVTGDRNLDVALRSLEVNPQITRTTVTPLS